MAEDILHIRHGDGFPILALGGAILCDKGVGVAGHVGRIGVDDLIVVPTRSGKVLGNPGLRIGDPLAQDLIDGKSDVAYVLDDSGVVIENGLAWSAAAGQTAKDEGRQHKDEQHRQEQKDGNSRHDLPDVFPALPECPGDSPIGAAHRSAFCGGSQRLACFDRSTDCARRACGFLQAGAMFLHSVSSFRKLCCMKLHLTSTLFFAIIGV